MRIPISITSAIWTLLTFGSIQGITSSAQDTPAPPAEEAAQLPSPDFQAANEESKQKLEAAIQRLNLVREKIATDKPQIAANFEKVRSELLTKRRQSETAKLKKSDQRDALARAERDHALLQQDIDYTRSLISGLPDQILSRAPSVETELLKQAMPSAPSSQLPLEQRAIAEMDRLEKSFERIESLLGGRVIEASVIAPNGEEASGQAAIFGPMAWFHSAQTSGQIHDSGDLIPRVREAGNAKATEALIKGQESTLRFDITGGAAQALAEMDNSPIDLVQQGGFWVWPILFIALVSVVCGLIKLAELIKIRTPSETWVNDLLEQVRAGETEAAIKKARSASHPAGNLLARGIERAKSGPQVVEEIIYEGMIGVQSKLQKWLPFIAITAATAPLLGLLGTVSGMIRTFNVIQIFGSGDPKPLAGGISEALVTTLFGLVVAIPALILHAMLNRRCQGILQTSERLGITFVNGLRGGLGNTVQRPPESTKSTDSSSLPPPNNDPQA